MRSATENDSGAPGAPSSTVLRFRGDARSLLIASVLNSGLGVLFWLATTRFYPVESVGRATTILNAAIALAGVANFALGPLFERFLPVAGRWKARLTWAGQGGTAIIGLLLAGGYVLLGPREELCPGVTEVIVFLVSVPVLSWFSLQDSILIGVHAGRWAAVQNVAHAVAKLVIVVALASAGTALDIVVSWIAPAVIAVAIVQIALAISPRLLRAESWREPTLPPVRTIVSFSALAALWMLAQATPGVVVPALIVSESGADTAAYFNIVWTLVTVSAVLVTMVAGPFVSEVSRDDADVATLTRAFLRAMLLVGVGRAVALATLGPIALWLYGSAYAQQGIPVLLAIAAGQALSTPAVIYGNLARAAGRIGYATGMQVVGAVLLIVAVLVLLPFGLVGVGIAYLLHDLYVTLASAPRLLPLMRRMGEGRR